MPKPKAQRIREAREHLERARAQWNDACVDSWEPSEPAESVTKAFYAFENALTAVALALGERLTTKHYEKAELAANLVKRGKLKTDVSDRLVELNGLRKDVQYGVPGEELENADLEDILTDLEYFLEEVAAVIDSIAGER